MQIYFIKVPSFQIFKVKQRVKFLRFVPEKARGGGGRYWCSSRWAVGASRLVSAQIFAIQMGVRGASFSAAADFFGAG